MPFMVPWTRLAPSPTAAIEFATPHSASLWVWIPTTSESKRSTTARVACRISCGRLDPLVSHSVTFSAPASSAASRHSSAYSESSR